MSKQGKASVAGNAFLKEQLSSTFGGTAPLTQRANSRSQRDVVFILDGPYEGEGATAGSKKGKLEKMIHGGASLYTYSL